MEPIEEQVIHLTTKVDALHQIIDQINMRLSEALAASPSLHGGLHHANQASHVDAFPSVARSYGQRGLEETIDHKDILLDSSYLDMESQTTERILSPEVQIQRLTAQLTAAYNRIAALEEQLLACRAH